MPPPVLIEEGSLRMLSVRSNRLPALVLPLLVIALVACGGSTQSTTATAGASATPTTAAARIQATQPAPIATATTPGTPTPLANALPRATTAATEAGRATGAATTAVTANADTPTPLARSTANVGVVTNASTATTSATIARATQALGSAATSATASAPTSVATATLTSATASVSTSGSAVTGTGVVGTPTTTPVPTNEARGATEQFLRTVLAKGDISGDLTPALKSQTGSDGYKLLNIQPPVKSFTIDSQQRDADGNGATVQATITTATGVVTRTFVMRKQGNVWLVDNVLG